MGIFEHNRRSKAHRAIRPRCPAYCIVGVPPLDWAFSAYKWQSSDAQP